MLSFISIPSDFGKFLVYLSRIEDGNKDDVLSFSKDLEFEDFRLYYYKSECFYREYCKDKTSEELLKRALDYAILSLRLRKKAQQVDAVCLNNLNLYLPEGSEYVKATREFVPISRIYFLLGELYACLRDDNRSRESYIKYHFYSERIDSDFENEYVYLYSFRPFSEYVISDLVNNEITVSHASVVNDPFDSLVIPWLKIQSQMPVGLYNYDHLKLLEQSYSYFRFRSFVTTPKLCKSDSIFRNILMWSHYADKHKGICICYKLSKKFYSKRDEESLKWNSLRRITYVKHAPHLIANYIYDRDAFLTKASNWSYEKEVRLLSFDPTTESKYSTIKLDIESSVSSIYLGCEFPEKQIKIIEAILPKNKKTSIIRMERDVRSQNYYLLLPNKIEY